MEGQSGGTGTIMDELHSSDHLKFQVKMVLPEVSLMNFILEISKENDWKVKVVLLVVSLVNFILGISKEINWKEKVVSLEV